MDEIAPRKKSSIQSAKEVLIAILIAMAVLYFLIAIGSTSSPTPSARPSFSSVSVGNQGRLANGTPEVPVAIDEATVSDIIRAPGSHDSNGMSYLSGRIFFVTGDILVQVSESGATASRVRILTGPQKGRLGWVPIEWVKPLG